MDALMGKIREAEIVFWGFRVYELVLDVIICILASILFTQIIGLHVLFSIPVALACSFFVLYKEAKRVDVVAFVDERYESLRERLKTAHDNIKDNNIIINELKKDVSNRLESIETSSFVDHKGLSRRVYVIIGLIFVLITATVFDLRSFSDRFMNSGLLNGVNDVVNRANRELQEVTEGSRWEASDEIYKKVMEKEKLGAEPGGEKPGYSRGPIPGEGWGAGAEESPDIYGEASAANLYGKDMDFKLHPEYGGDIDIHETHEGKTSVEFTAPVVKSAETCEECVIGPEYEEIVRKYFERIVGENK